MPEHIKYSVIIPTFKTPLDLVERCCNSVLGLKRDDTEIILVEALENAGSPLSGSDLLKSSYLHYIVSQTIGVSFQRNLAISKAKGEFLVFLDSDDFLHPEFFEIADRSLADFPKADLIAFSFFSSDVVPPVSYSKSEFRRFDSTKDIFSFFCHFRGVESFFIQKSMSSKIVRRSIVINNNLMFDVSLSNSEDHLFLLRLLDFCKLVLAGETYCLYHYTLSANSSMSKSSNNSPAVYNSIINSWKTSILGTPHGYLTQSCLDENVVFIYLPRMMAFYFCTPLCSKKKSIVFAEFKQTVKNRDYQSSIRRCSYKFCPTAKKKIQLFLLKNHWYHFYFGLFWKIYHR
jgi:Glycosyltransferases involved in cell wall biogenesis